MDSMSHISMKSNIVQKALFASGIEIEYTSIDTEYFNPVFYDKRKIKVIPKEESTDLVKEMSLAIEEGFDSICIESVIRKRTWTTK